MATAANYKLKLNGVEATAQQVYDAFMTGPIRLVDNQSDVVGIPYTMYWENSDGTKTNPKAVSYVALYYSFVSSDNEPVPNRISVGTKYVSDEK